MAIVECAPNADRKPGGGSAPDRRVDLDWIRIGAFGLLILYHIALFFGPTEWHIDSRHTQPWIGSALVLSNPWRLTLLFLVSGAAVHFMTRKMSVQHFLSNRTARLMLPFLFGVVVLVPPQAWVEDVVRSGLTRSYLDYWARYFTIDRGLCLAGNCPAIPLNHLWFVLYIWAYSVVLAVLLLRPAPLRWLERGLARVLRGPWVLILPILYLAATRVLLFPHFGITNKLFNDSYNHSVSFAAFLLGFCLVGQQRFWTELERYRWVALVPAAAGAAVLMRDGALPPQDQHPTQIGMMVAYAFCQWGAMAAILGFGSRHLRRADTPALRYLREGVFPFYLVHQTIIIVAAWVIDSLDFPPAVEAGMLIGITVLGCLATFELVKRVDFLRPLLGLKPAPRDPAEPQIGKVLAEQV